MFTKTFNRSIRIAALATVASALTLPASSAIASVIVNASSQSQVSVHNSNSNTSYDYASHNITAPDSTTINASSAGNGSGQISTTLNSTATIMQFAGSTAWEGAVSNRSIVVGSVSFTIDTPMTYSLTGSGAATATDSTFQFGGDLGETLIGDKFQHSQEEYVWTGSKSYTLGTLDNTSSYSLLSGSLTGTLLPGTYYVNFYVAGNVDNAGGSGSGSGDLTLTLTALPEPTTLGFIGLAGMGLLRRRRMA